MINMFDKDGSGTVGFDEFVALWRFLAAWRELFERFDEDRSGRISLQEFSNALQAFGYRLSQPFVGVIFSTFESRGRKTPGPGMQNYGMSFDLFVQACVSLKRMTDVFKKYDEDRDGYVTLSFEEFLSGECRFPPFSPDSCMCISQISRDMEADNFFSPFCFEEILRLRE